MALEQTCQLVMNEFIDTIVNAVHDNKIYIGVWIYLKKASDTADHSLLIKKNKIYGVKCICSKFLDSYLKDGKIVCKL